MSDELDDVDVNFYSHHYVTFQCDCGIHNRYSIMGDSKPDVVICQCGKKLKSK